MRYLHRNGDCAVSSCNPLLTFLCFYVGFFVVLSLKSRDILWYAAGMPGHCLVSHNVIGGTYCAAFGLFMLTTFFNSVKTHVFVSNFYVHLAQHGGYRRRPSFPLPRYRRVDNCDHTHHRPHEYPRLSPFSEQRAAGARWQEEVMSCE